jgi:putative salt-induced outer membrane protein YdiY
MLTMNLPARRRHSGRSAPILSRFASLLAGLLLCSAPAIAGDWQPPVPMPDEFDWVQLTSGEWLKGQLKVLYEKTVEFDSDKLGLLELDIEDVAVIRSAQTVNVRAAGDQSAVGKLLLENDSVKVIGESTAEYARDGLISITAGVPKERNFWSGVASMGANLRSGNTDQTEATTQLHFKRRTIQSRMLFDYIGNYTITNDVESANNHRANANWDRFVSDRFFLRPLFLEYFRDPFQNIADRATVGTGLGYQPVDTPRTEWSVFAGPAYQWTRFADVESGEDSREGTWALSAGTTFDHDITERIDFRYDYRFQVTSVAAGRYNHHMIAGFSFDLTDYLNMDVSMVWDRTEKPQRNADGTLPEQDDYRLIFGLGYDF